ncbi:MAG: polysaccharide deacetylase family protein [Bacteroidia bacterium]|nr:polysaccharide deacetylase family protein [Bacteroidia bacterium]
MLFSQLPVTIFKKIYPKAIFSLDKKNEIALTFDDGPTPIVTEYVLDVLHHYNIRATFFCVGQNIEQYEDLFEKILKKEHTIGNHTYSHVNGWKTKNKEYFDDIERTRHAFETNLFRPPYGKIRLSQYQHLVQQHYKIVFWNLISYDYHPKMDRKKCMNLLKKHTIGGQIVLFHDSQKSFGLISEILPEYIEFCQKLNLNFVPLKF